MSAFVVKNASFWISNGAAAVAVTGATKGATTAIVAANTLVAGNFVQINNSGWSSLEGKFAKVAATPVPTATGFTLEINTSAETTTFPATGATATLLGANSWLEACVAGFDVSGGAADSIGVGTFCNSAAALAGAPGASTVALSGFVDLNSPGYMELVKASVDGLPRAFRFVMPQAADPGATAPPVMLFSGTVGAADSSFQTGAAATFTATVTLAAKPTIIRTP